MNFTVIRCFKLSACVLLLYVMGGREGGGDCNNYAANIMHRHIKFSHLGGQMAQICAPNLTKSIQEAIFICLLVLATVEVL